MCHRLLISCVDLLILILRAIHRLALFFRNSKENSMIKKLFIVKGFVMLHKIKA